MTNSKGPVVAPNTPALRTTGLLLSAATVLLCLAAGELILRRWFPFEVAMRQRDARYLYRNKPDARTTKHEGDTSESYIVAINHQGRYGPVVSDTRRPRIIVYGDSFIAGEYTPPEHTFVADLERLLQARASQTVQVINAGVMGYGPDQESLVMEDDIGVLKPDLVVVAIDSHNDFGNLLTNKLFLLNDHEQLAAQHPVYAPNVETEFAESENVSAFQTVLRLQNVAHRFRPAKIIGTLKTLLHAGHADSPKRSKSPADPNKYLQSLLAQREDEYRSAVLERDPHVYQLFFETYDADISLQPDSPSARYKALLMKRIMERVEGIAVRHRVPCVFLIIPGGVDAGRSDLPVDTTAYPAYKRSQLTDALQKIGDEDHLLFLNLFQPFYDHRADELYYHDAADHWNRKGQQLAADLLAEYVLSHNLLSRGLDHV